MVMEEMVALPASEPSSALLPAFDAPATDRIWLVAAHGGAGCSTIYASSPDLYADAGRALPVSVDPGHPSRIVLCSMCTSPGLESLQALVREWREGRFGASALMGLAVTGCRRRTPRVLVRSRRLVCSVVDRRRSFPLPFIPDTDIDGVPEKFPHAYSHMSKALSSLDAMAVPFTANQPDYRSEGEQQ